MKTSRTDGKRGVIFLGDFMLGRHVLGELEKTPLERLLAGIRTHTSQYHVVVNLESPLVERDVSARTKTAKRLEAPVQAARQLKNFGITAVGLANNHIFDCGYDGIRSTIRALTRAGIEHTGSGANRSEATRPVILEAAGRRIGVAAFSYWPPATAERPGVGYLYDDTVEKVIGSIRPDVDFLAIMPHAGIELFRYPLPREQRLYRQMIDWGADLVVGSHSHCVQAMEIYRERHIFYGLGDCVFDHFHPEVWNGFWAETAHPKRFGISAEKDVPRHSLMVRADLFGPKPRIDFYPLKMGERPDSSPLSGSAKQRWEEGFRRLCSDFRFSEPIRAHRETIERRLMTSLKERGLL